RSRRGAAPGGVRFRRAARAAATRTRVARARGGTRRTGGAGPCGPGEPPRPRHRGDRGGSATRAPAPDGTTMKPAARLLLLLAALCAAFLLAVRLGAVTLEPGEIARALTGRGDRSEEHTSELQSRENLVCRLL